MRHDKRYDALEALDDYELVNEEHDIRGRPIVSETGEQYGIIRDLLVGEDKDRVVAVRLEDGNTCAIEHLEIHANAVVYGAAAAAYANEGVASGDVVEQEVIPVVEESIVVGKRVADHGRDITVRRRVVSEEVSEDVMLRDETVSIETRAVNERISTEDAEALLNKADATVSMTEHSEEVVVAKEAVITEEVVIKKTVDDTIEHVTETVRKTEVDVEDSTSRT